MTTKKDQHTAGKGDDTRRALAAALIATFLFICVIAAPAARVADSEIESREAKSIAVAPVAARNGKNVALILEVRPDTPRALPRGATILVNGKQVHLYDDGRWPDGREGDGLYAAAARTKDGKPLRERTVSPIRTNAATFDPVSMALSIGCTFKSVKCPSGCKSIIFGTKCVVCLEFESCELSF
jgi:hypothetical protein